MFVNITTVAGKNTTNQKHTATTSLRKYCFFVSCAMGTFMYDILNIIHPNPIQGVYATFSPLFY